MENYQFSGFISDVFSKNDKYSFYYDGKKLNLNLLEDEGVGLGMEKKEEFLMANLTTGGLVGLYNNICRNNIIDDTAVIYPSMIFIPRYAGPIKNKFNRLLFKGKIVNLLFPPIQKVKYDSARNLKAKFDGSKKIILKSFDETDVDFETTINQEQIHCKFGVYWPGTINPKDEDLGKLVSYFEIHFEEEKDIKEILPLYISVRKFFQFLIKQKDIYFEEIEVGLKSSNGNFDKIGYFIDNTAKLNDIKLSYTINNLVPNIGKLFSKITENDLNNNFIAKDNFEAKYITPESYIKVCGAFEHNYELIFKTLPKKDKYKIDSIEYIKQILDEKIEKEKLNKNYKKYYKHIIEVLYNDLNSVATQYNRCLGHYQPAIDDFLIKILHRYGLKNEKLLGDEFSKFRNNDAHGGVIEFTNPSICAFLVGLVLIECMIFEEADYTLSEIKEIIKSRYNF